jgi:hypothetical protein
MKSRNIVERLHMKTSSTLASALIAFLVCNGACPSQGPGSKTDYEWAGSLRERLQNKVFRAEVKDASADRLALKNLEWKTGALAKLTAESQNRTQI